MSKISIENKKGKITITNRLTYPETVNERVYNAIASGMFPGFLPVTIEQKRKETRIECSVQGMMPLRQYFGGYVTKKMFLDFVHEIALQIKTCEKSSINANNLSLQSDTIFIDGKTKNIKMVFWPVVNNQIENPPYMFLSQLPFQLTFGPAEDITFLKTYNAFFSGVNPFSVNNFDKMVLKLAGKTNTEYSGPSGMLSDMSSDSKRIGIPARKEVVEYNPFNDTTHVAAAGINNINSAPDINNIFCAYCGARNRVQSNFCCKCGAKIQKKPQNAPLPVSNAPVDDLIDTFSSTVDNGAGETTVLGADPGGTTVLGLDKLNTPPVPYLIRSSNDEKISVDKPVFRIGKEKYDNDYHVADNSAVSRRHACILSSNNRYYIEDLNSTNKTYVEGKAIPIEKQVEIFNGSKIRLANEDFIFYID